MTTTIDRCPVCDDGDFVEVYNSTFGGVDWRDAVPFFLTERARAVRGRIVRCRGCGFVFTNPQFSAQEYGRIYAEANRGPDDMPAIRYRRLAKKVLEMEPGPGRFLDFGCGAGGFLDALAGFDGIGFEIAVDIPAGIEQAGQIVRGDILTEAPAAATVGLVPNSFDFIVAWDVLEHLAEPARTLRRLRELLKPGGRLYLTLPNLNSPAARLFGSKWNCILLEHLWYFTPTTLGRFLGRCGFDVGLIEPIGFAVDIETVFLRLRQTYGPWIPRPPRFIRPLIVTLPIGLMFAAARRSANVI